MFVCCPFLVCLLCCRGLFFFLMVLGFLSHGSMVHFFPSSLIAMEPAAVQRIICVIKNCSTHAQTQKYAVQKWQTYNVLGIDWSFVGVILALFTACTIVVVVLFVVCVSFRL